MRRRQILAEQAKTTAVHEQVRKLATCPKCGKGFTVNRIPHFHKVHCRGKTHD
jgi:ribosomal protein L37AE/L43A